MFTYLILLFTVKFLKNETTTTTSETHVFPSHTSLMQPDGKFEFLNGETGRVPRGKPGMEAQSCLADSHAVLKCRTIETEAVSRNAQSLSVNITAAQ